MQHNTAVRDAGAVSPPGEVYWALGRLQIDQLPDRLLGAPTEVR